MSLSWAKAGAEQKSKPAAVARVARVNRMMVILQRSPEGLSAWVCLLITVLQALGCHMGVNLRRPQTAVAQQLLNAADVGAVVEQMGRETVPQTVRTGAGVQPRFGQVFFEQSADAARR